ncbi:MAG: MaoC family dehydratase [Thermoplasmata archaeon]
MKNLKVGDKIDGNELTVNDYHIFSFAGLTGDYNRLHVDDEFAKNTIYKGRIGHGLLSLSLGLGLLFHNIDGYFLYGFDKIRFLNPVRPGMTIKSELVVNRIKNKENYTLYYCSLKVIGKNNSEILISEIILGKMKENASS